jgi:superfamily I DNA/RNA helicase
MSINDLQLPCFDGCRSRSERHIPLTVSCSDTVSRADTLRIDQSATFARRRRDSGWLGRFGVDDKRVTLAHDDIPLYMSQLLAKPKFRILFQQQFPIVFIDEYQDTDRGFMTATTDHFFTPKVGPLIGLFGDHWQTIYNS